MSKDDRHVPSFDTLAPRGEGIVEVRAVCSCGWRAPTVKRGAKGKALATAKDDARREALEHARDVRNA